MRVMGIDPGSRRTGYAVIERRGTHLTPVCYGTIRLGRDDMPARLRRLFEQLTEVVSRHTPEAVAVEGIFHAKHAGSALKLGHARGVALLVAARHELCVHEYAPKAVKRAVTSSGAADKGQVQRMVRMLLGLDEEPQEDAADALAVAICHAQSTRVTAHRGLSRKS